jgi:hypothetical protein
VGPEQEPAEENGAMRIEACDGEQVDDFVVVEDGTYRMRVGEVRPARTGDGRESWMLRMELDGGDLAGRTAVLDWLNFTERGLHRVRLVLAALGFDVSASMDVEPEELLGRVADVRIATQESRRESDGRLLRRSRVAYDGWSPAAGDPRPLEDAMAAALG